MSSKGTWRQAVDAASRTFNLKEEEQEEEEHIVRTTSIALLIVMT